MKPLVIYHANCSDGFCAAWLLYRDDPSSEFFPAHYGTEPPDCAGRNVVIADFSYPRATILKIMQEALSVVVLDHHKTAVLELEGIVSEFVQSRSCRFGEVTPIVYFDMNKSGGRLTWDYLLRSRPARYWSNRPRPWLVDYTEDRDLWCWKLPQSREVNAAIRSYPLTFDQWSMMAENDPASFVSAGAAILRREKQIVADHVKQAVEATIGGHAVKVVNATVLFSEIAGELANGQPFGACYFDRADGKRQYSLRSTKDGMDVSEVAKRYGGGGHHNAAGFELAQGKTLED